MQRQQDEFFHSQRGGITVLTVLGLIVVATVLAFSLSRNAIRELSTSGTVWQGLRASEASEAGLDWFLLWSNKDNTTEPTSLTRGRETLHDAFRKLSAPGTWNNSTINSYLLDKNKLWDRAVLLPSPSEASVSSSDMVFTSGSGTIQSFDLVWRYLGESDIKTMSSGNTKPSPNAPKTGRELNLFQVISTGKASVPLGADSGFMRYQANREMYTTLVP